MRQILLKNVTAILLQNATVLLQNATVITNSDGFLTKCDSYYKMRRSLQIATVHTSDNTIDFITINFTNYLIVT